MEVDHPSNAVSNNLATQADPPTPMEGVAASGDANGANPLQGEYMWEVPNFTKQEAKIYSENFEVGGYSWNMLCFPRGNQKENQVSLYLAVPPSASEEGSYWRQASFKLSVINQIDPTRSIVKDTRHNFTDRENDWGFTNYMPLDELLDPSKGFIVNDTVKFKVDIIVNSPQEALYDSRKETGFVGLKNQGATCYMNSLLQSLYNVNQFRKAVYHMPTAEDADPETSMPLALQSVFYKLQFTDGPVSTKDLTRSFGWDSSDAFQQHDVQELARILCDRLEEKMKGTRVEGMITKLFEGHFFNYIECINVDCKSTRQEAFQDLQLDVKGCKTIYDSFDKYCEVEVLDGDNKYEAEGFGKQDARKGVLFDDFPPVLQLHLKRFEYDFMKDMMVKINDRYEFFDELDLDKVDENGKRKYLSPNADKNVRNKYRLLGVLVHSGGVHGGHYYAFVRPDGTNWLKFDDERVENSDVQKAIDENWGGEDEKPAPAGFGQPIRLTKFSNAYMLVYVRESEWNNIMCEVRETDISEHVRARLAAEQAEKERKRRERAEAHLYTLVRVVTDADIAAQIGHDRFFDLVDMEKVSACLKMKKKATFREVAEEMARRTGVPVEKQRYWRWLARVNQTNRPATHFDGDYLDQTLLSLQEKSGPLKRPGKIGEMAKLDVFLETPIVEGGDLPVWTKQSALLFFKQYFPETEADQHLKYAGRLLVPNTMPPKDFLPKLAQRVGLPANTPLLAFEEVKSEPSVMVDEIDISKPLASLDIESGDIIVFQRQLPEEDAMSADFPNAIGFLKDVRNRLVISFRKLDENQDEVFSLELLKDMPYDKVSAAVAGKLGLDHPLKVRFTGQSHFSQLPKSIPLRYNGQLTLEEMLRGGQYGVHSSVLYFEALDLPLPEFEQLVSYRISFHNSKHEEVQSATIRLPKDKTVEEMLEEYRKFINEEHHKGQPLRLMEVYQWKIWQMFDPKAPVQNMGDNVWHLRAEVIPTDQRKLDQDDELHVHCQQVTDDGNQKAFAFSDPFIMKVGKDETVGQLKKRVQKEMEVPDAEFKEWQVVLIMHLASPEHLDDNVVIANRLNRVDLGPAKLYGHHDRAVLGFSHTNKNPRKTHAHINRNPSAFGQERQLKIRA